MLGQGGARPSSPVIAVSSLVGVPPVRADQGMWRCLIPGKASRSAQWDGMGWRRGTMPLEEPSSDAVQQQGEDDEGYNHIGAIMLEGEGHH
jgi:hypothetical protein